MHLLLSSAPSYLAFNLSHLRMHCFPDTATSAALLNALAIFSNISFLLVFGFPNRCLYSPYFSITKQQSGLPTSVVWPWHSLQERMLQLAVVGLPWYLLKDRFGFNFHSHLHKWRESICLRLRSVCIKVIKLCLRLTDGRSDTCTVDAHMWKKAIPHRLT